jgi:VWFA-related protein
VFTTIVLAVAVVLLIPISVSAQRFGTNLPPLTERIEVKVINVDVVVTDASGRPVTNLGKDDFEIYEDGEPQKITNFYVIENAAVKGDAPAVVAAAALTEARDQFRRRFILLVDNNYIDKIQRDAALKEIDKFVDDTFKGEHEWAIAAISQRLEVLHPFTSDKRAIHDAIDKIRHSGAFPEQHALDRSILNDRLRRMEVSNPDYGGLIPTVDYDSVVRFQAREQTYRALRALRNTGQAVRELTRSYAAAEGKKVLILLTGGMETNTSFKAYDIGVADRELTELKRQIGLALDDVVFDANAANFAVHIINAKRRGMIAPQHEVENQSSGIHPNADFTTQGADPIDTTDVDSSSLTVAVGTGGSYSTNLVDRSLASIETISSNFYSLGYSPRHEDDRRYHSIKVRVKRGGLQLAHRKGYLDLPPEERFEQFLQARISIGEKIGSLPVGVQIGAAQPRESGVTVPVVTTLPMDRITVIPVDGQYVGRVHVYVSVFDQEGKNVGFEHQMQEVTISPSQYEQIASANFRYKLNVQLAKGAFTVVITLRDDLSNEIGSATQAVNI